MLCCGLVLSLTPRSCFSNILTAANLQPSIYSRPAAHQLSIVLQHHSITLTIQRSKMDMPSTAPGIATSAVYATYDLPWGDIYSRFGFSPSTSYHLYGTIISSQASSSTVFALTCSPSNSQFSPTITVGPWATDPKATGSYDANFVAPQQGSLLAFGTGGGSESVISASGVLSYSTHCAMTTSAVPVTCVAALTDGSTSQTTLAGTAAVGEFTSYLGMEKVTITFTMGAESSTSSEAMTETGSMETETPGGSTTMTQGTTSTSAGTTTSATAKGNAASLKGVGIGAVGIVGLLGLCMVL